MPIFSLVRTSRRTRASESKRRRYYDMLLEIPVMMCEGSGFVLEHKRNAIEADTVDGELPRPLWVAADARGKPLCSWNQFYDTLLRISVTKCRGLGMPVEQMRFGVDTDGATLPMKRPDCCLMHRGILYLRGEERDALAPTGETLEKMMTTMGHWSVMLHGDLPYVLAYAAAGEYLEIVAIERSISRPLHWTSIHRVNILADKETALTAFVNLGTLLHEMARHLQRPYGCYLEPFKASANEHRTIVLMENVVVRTVVYGPGDDARHLQRVRDVYKALETLNKPNNVQVPSLQTVKLIKEECSRIIVHLSPVGCIRKPNTREVKQWLHDMLVALVHWHRCGYCHGDVQWRNIVFVPCSSDSEGASASSDDEDGDEGGHYMLIDMDKSRKPNTKAITKERARNYQ